MKIYNILMAIFTVLCISCSNNVAPTNCATVHIGTFEFIVKSKSGEKIPFTIFRSDSMQIEVADGTTDSTFFSINWIDKCNYSLLLQRSTFAMDAQQANISKTIPIQSSVDFIGDGFYVFTAERKANDFKITDTLYIK
jgi:hypothetical protein